MAKNYWKSDKGKAAIRQAAVTDAAGAMKVGPGVRGASPTIGGALGSPSGMNPVRGPFSLTPAKLVTQGPTTGFGSFRNGVLNSLTRGKKDNL